MTNGLKGLIAVIIFQLLIIFLLVSCPYNEAASAERYKVTDERRKVVGDIYDPGHGRRIQIRDERRRIVGYIERGGKVTDKRRRKIGQINE